jgi:membrane-bound ClpP family serine protease
MWLGIFGMWAGLILLVIEANRPEDFGSIGIWGVRIIICSAVLTFVGYSVDIVQATPLFLA